MAADESLRQGEPEPAETSPAPAAAGDLGPLVASPDVMLAAANLEDLRRGDCQWVLSECHRSVGCAGFFVRPMPDQKRWLAELSAFLADALSPSQPVLITQPMHNKTCRLGHLPCVRYLEVGLGAPPEGTTVEMDEIAMTLDDEPGLVLRETAQPIVVLPPGLARPSFADRVFDPPSFRLLPAAGAGRRVVSRSILVTRASWELPGKNLIGPHASAWEVFVWAQSERARNRLPRWIFVHPKSELKPMCIDFANPFLCEELLRLLRRDQELLIREMVPSPAEAWVTSPDGRHLSEIRLLYAAGR
ncbi:MAG: hypothetical protein GY856_07815 [bacterium]|nr:hypothetical protein [bacterium]